MPDIDEELTNLIRGTIDVALPGTKHAVHALTRLAETHDSPAVPVLVAGEVSRGKSTLINALLGSRVMPGGPAVTTAAWTLLRYGTQMKGKVTVQEGDGDIEQYPVNTPKALVTYLSVDGKQTLEDRHGVGARVVSATLDHPAPLLQTGLQLIDTPGVGGLRAVHRQAALNGLAEADALLFVIRPGEPITVSERTFLADASERVGTCIIVQTHRDKDANARDYLAQDLATLTDEAEWTKLLGDPERARRLAAYFAKIKGVSVSSENALLAAQEPDADVRDALRASSGIDVLEETLRDEVTAAAQTVHRRAVVRLAELVLRNTAKSARSRAALFSGDTGAADAIAERQDTISRWVAHSAHLWQPAYQAATARIPGKLRKVANERTALLKDTYTVPLQTSGPQDIESLMPDVLAAPAEAFAEMLRTIDTSIEDAVADVRELLANDGLAGRLDEELATAAVFARLPGKFTAADPDMDRNDILKQGLMGGLAGTTASTTGVLILTHGAWIGGTAATVTAPLFIPFLIGAGVYIWWQQQTKKRVKAQTDARAVLATAGEEITTTALRGALSVAESLCRRVEEDIEAGLSAMAEQVKRDLEELSDSTKLVAADRLACIEQDEQRADRADTLLGTARRLRMVID